MGVHGVEMPVFVSPAAMARLVHPEGERAIARAVGGRGVVQCVCFFVFFFRAPCIFAVHI